MGVLRPVPIIAIAIDIGNIGIFLLIGEILASKMNNFLSFYGQF